MVYIDVRDRKFIGIFVVPVVVAAIFLLLGMLDGGAEVELVAVLLAIVAAIFFVIYLATQFVLERVRE